MRRYAVFLLVCLSFIFVAPAGAQVAFEPDTANAVTLTCNSGGTATATIQAGFYEVVVLNEAVNYCLYASTCPTGGSLRGLGNHGLIWVKGESAVSCRGSGSGQLNLTPGRPIR